MKPEEHALLRGLLVDRQMLSLGVLIENQPYVGMVPFAVREDFSALIIHASRLARHTRGLADGAPYGALIHVLEVPGMDVQQMARVSLQGTVRVPQPGTKEYGVCKDLYIRKFPQSEMTFSLGDFQIYELALESGRLVIGFARTTNLNAGHFRKLTEP